MQEKFLKYYKIVIQILDGVYGLIYTNNLHTCSILADPTACTVNLMIFLLVSASLRFHTS